MRNLIYSVLSLIVSFLFVSGNMFGQGQKREMLSGTTYRITKTTKDKKYGYTESNPIKVGGVKNNEGPLNEIRFLNALLGPKGEEVVYERIGSCCFFETPNAPQGGTGLLDKYKVTYEGLKIPIILYLNMYDEGDLFIPTGFSEKKEISTVMKTSPEKFNIPTGHIVESEGLVGFWRQFIPLPGDENLTEYGRTSNFKVINADKSIYAFVNWPAKSRKTPDGDFYSEKEVTDISFYGTYTVDSDSIYTEYIISHSMNPAMNGTKSLMRYQVLNKNIIKVAYKNEAIGIWIDEYWRRVLPANK